MAKRTKTKPTDLKDISPQWLSLDQLHLDTDNPRFGARLSAVGDEGRILDEIVESHGVKDVLSSLAANGFFASEPLVGAVNKSRDDGIVILEGNRRLAACLILADDPRAERQNLRRRQHPDSRFKQGDLVPVLVYDWSDLDHRRRLLPYLGIRHIVGAQPWDSYAKAAWVASVLQDGSMKLDEIINMIGDSNRTVARILDGFYFVRQVYEADRFKPEHSQRKGRGSNPEFPFSWVYSALDYQNIRRFVGLPDLGTEPSPKAVPQGKIDEAGELMTFLFGDKEAGRSPVVGDSRQLKDLAAAVEDDESLRMLREGKNVEEARRRTRPAFEQIKDYLWEASGLAEEAGKLVASRSVKEPEAEALGEPALRLSRTATRLRKRLSEIAAGSDEEADEDVH